MFDFLQDNTYKLLFTGVAAIIIGVISKLINDSKKEKKSLNPSLDLKPIENANEVQNNFNPTLNFFNDTQGSNDRVKPEPIIDQKSIAENLDKRKLITKILFIDDDTKFKVVNILKKSGWTQTKVVKDIDNIDDTSVKESDIFFVDIQGVGKALECKDEGLGLALTLRKKYPYKKIIIYSAETKGDRFHEGLQKADAFLAKNAEPYEFLQLVEQFSEDLHQNV